LIPLLTITPTAQHHGKLDQQRRGSLTQNTTTVSFNGTERPEHRRIGRRRRLSAWPSATARRHVSSPLTVNEPWP